MTWRLGFNPRICRHICVLTAASFDMNAACPLRHLAFFTVLAPGWQAKSGKRKQSGGSVAGQLPAEGPPAAEQPASPAADPPLGAHTSPNLKLET